MTRCTKCNGGKVLRTGEAILDNNLNSEHTLGNRNGATPCQQCNGTGIQNSFGV